MVESLDAEFSGPPFHTLCGTGHFFTEPCPGGYLIHQHKSFSKMCREDTFSEQALDALRRAYQEQNSAPRGIFETMASDEEIMSLADQKAKEAADTRSPMNRMELMVTRATENNFRLLDDCLKQVVEATQSVFDERWLPGPMSPADIMATLDDAKNLLTVAQVYFNAVTIPLMQSASIAVHMMEQHTVHEPSAEDRLNAVKGRDLEGKRVRITNTNMSFFGWTGFVSMYDSEDNDYGIRFSNGEIYWLERSNFEIIED